MRRFAACIVLLALTSLPLYASPNRSPTPDRWTAVVEWLRDLVSTMEARLDSGDSAGPYEQNVAPYGGMIDPLGGETESGDASPPPSADPNRDPGGEHGGMIDPLG